MSTFVLPPSSAYFDLDEAITEAWPVILRAYPEWNGDDQTGLAEAIHHDAEALVAANGPVDGPVQHTVAAIEEHLLDEFLSTLMPAEPQGVPSTSGFSIRLVDGIAEIAPYLTRGQCSLLAGEVVYPILEGRVGEVLAEGMSDAQLELFGSFVEKDTEAGEAWLAANRPGYETSDAFRKFVEANPGASWADIVSGFCARCWLEDDQPHYPQVVAQQWEYLKAALAELVAEVGEDAMCAWARTRQAWADVLERATDKRGVITGAAFVVDLEGGEAFAQWASVENLLLKLDERTAAMDAGAR